MTSAALWLNHKAQGENLITCVKLTPFQDTENNSLYIQATTIIPVPGVDDYVVGIGSNKKPQAGIGGSSLGDKLRKRFQQNMGDDVTRFARQVAALALEGLPAEIRPDKVSRWAGGWEHFRYYNLWYSRPPWTNTACAIASRSGQAQSPTPILCMFGSTMNTTPIMKPSMISSYTRSRSSLTMLELL